MTAVDKEEDYIMAKIIIKHEKRYQGQIFSRCLA